MSDFLGGPHSEPLLALSQHVQQQKPAAEDSTLARITNSRWRTSF
ncbi:hypothetical protein [Streptomyces sp. NPDC006285]